MSCKLIKEGGSYTKESVRQLQGKISSEFMDAITACTVNKICHTEYLPYAVARALANIGDEWDNSQVNDIVNAITATITNNPMFQSLKEYMPQQGIKNALLKKNRKQFEQHRSLEEYLEQEDLEEAEYKPSKFINDRFGNQATIKNQLKSEVSRRLIDTFIIDRTNGTLVEDITSANVNARRYKEQLFNDAIKGWATMYNMEIPKQIINADGTLRYYNDDGTNNMDLVQDIIVRAAPLIKTPKQLQTEHDNPNPSWYNAFKSWFTLTNFDNFVNLLLGDAVTKQIDGTYAYTNKSGNVVTTWRTNDNIDLSVEINKLTQSLITTTPYFIMGSNNPTESYITSEDFFTVIAKIKNLVYNPKVWNDQISLNDNVGRYYQKYVQEKSLGSVITSIRTNPQIYSKLVFQLLTNHGRMDNLGFTDHEKDVVWSLYKGVFENEFESTTIESSNNKGFKSINTIQSKYPYTAQNYYNMITEVVDSIFSVDFTQYYEDEGVIKVRNMRDQTKNQLLNRFVQTLNALNSRRILKNNYEQNCMVPWKAKVQRDQNYNLIGIEFKIGNVNYAYTIEHQQLIGKIPNVDDPDINKFYEFIDQQLHLDLIPNQEFRTMLFKRVGLGELMNLSAKIYFHKYLSNVELKDISGKRQTLARLKEIYGDDPLIPYDKYLQEMALTTKSDKPLLDKIVYTQMMASGMTQSIQVLNGDNDSLSTQTTSRLLGSMHTQFAKIKSNPNNPAAHFSFLQNGIFQGHYSCEEFKGNLNKSTTKFTVPEYVQGSFLYDFVGGLMQNDYGDAVVGNGKVAFYPSINSDKGTMGRIIIDLNQNVPGTRTRFINLSAKAIDQITAEELGKYYQKQWNQVCKDFETLSIAEGMPATFIQPDSNFQEFNEWCDNQGLKPSKELMRIVQKYNQSHQDKITLIDQTHYIADKTGHIHPNSTILALLDRYRINDVTRVYDNIKRYMNRKRKELLMSLVKENCQINLSNAVEGSPKSWLASNYKDWINPEGNMVFARITLKNGNSIQVSDMTDLQAYYEFLPEGQDRNSKENAIKEILRDPHQIADITLHPILDKYNSLDLLFGQEFLDSTVGSHTNHPAQKMAKRPIRYNYNLPAVKDSRVIYFNDILIKELALWREKLGMKLSNFNEISNLYNTDPEFKKRINYIWESTKSLATYTNKIIEVNDPLSLKWFLKDFDSIEVPNDAAFKVDINNYKALNPKGHIITPGSDAGLLEYKNQATRLDDIIDAEEAARYLAQVKRNVALTAAMFQFQNAQIDGIPSTYNIAVMSEMSSWVYTITGDITNNHDSFDGCTFVNPLIVYWENNSLRGNKAGTDKKQFCHAYDQKTGTGLIIKTAGFGVTNDRVRRYKFYRTMIYNMMHYQWKEENGTPLNAKHADITHDFNGNTIDYGEFYFQKEGKVYSRTILEYKGKYTYSVKDVDVMTGEENVHDISNINSNYALWNLFGGARSMEPVGDDYQFSENSLVLTSRAGYSVGIRRNKNVPVLSADDVYQPLKHSDVHYMCDPGAIKQGLGNANDKSMFFTTGDLNMMQIEASQLGIQLDKEHHADKGVLSLMTQVISASSSMGYMPSTQKEIKNSLKLLAELGTRKFRDAAKGLNFHLNNGADFDMALTQIIVDSVLNSEQRDGSLMVSIAKNIERTLGKDLTITVENKQKINKLLPISNPMIFRKIVSALTSALTKESIRVRIPGTLSVLQPSHEVIKFYRIPVNPGDFSGEWMNVTLEQLENYFYQNNHSDKSIDSPEWFDENLNYLQNVYGQQNELKNARHKINIGNRYLIRSVGGEPCVVRVVLPNRLEPKESGITVYNGKTYKVYDVGYQTLKERNNLSSIQEYMLDGQDLQSYNVRFADKNGNQYQLADLDIVQDYFDYRQTNDRIKPGKLAALIDKYNCKQEFGMRFMKDINNYKNTQQALINAFLTSGTIVEADEFIPGTQTRLDSKWHDLFVQRLQDLGKKFLNRKMQQALSAISPSQKNDVKALVNGQWVEVNKDTIQIQNYGVIMPKVFASSLGLSTYDNVEDIKHDPQFFTKKLLSRFDTKVQTGYKIIMGANKSKIANNFDVEFKRMDGKHIYVKVGDYENNDYVHQVEWESKVEDGILYRVINGKLTYPMYSADDQIYVDRGGNEIIVTKDIPPYYVDAKGNTIKESDVQQAGGKYVNTKNGEEVIKIDQPGLAFYMDKLHYSTLNINRQDEKRFMHWLDLAITSSNDSAYYYALDVDEGKTPQDKRLRAWQLNDYSTTNYLGNSSTKRTLQRIGAEMYTSFLQSLKVVAARIPAQNQQSFMAMDVQSYENPDINSAYVSIFQFYLQGSDLDVDAVSLQTFDLDSNGKYQGWSPYYRISNLKMKQLSDKLPFPNGKSVETNIESFEDSFIGKHINDFGYKDPTKLFNIRKTEEGYKIRVNIETEEQLSKMIDILNHNQDILQCVATDEQALVDPAIKRFNTEVVKAKNGESLVTKEDIESIQAQIADIINKHNLYLSTVGTGRLNSIIRNRITGSLYDVITDPVNAREAWSSVDTVTEPVEDLAAKSDKALMQSAFSPGNVVNKAQGVSENMTGKDGIAICATGLKSQFALTDLYSEYLSLGDADSLLSIVQIAGKNYNGLANGFDPAFTSALEHGKISNDPVEQYLDDQLWTDDASAISSALLGLSADNAKKLTLAKINANTTTLGMYLYGASLGVPIETLVKIINSPLGIRLVELSQGNMFEHIKGQGKLLSAFCYMFGDRPDFGYLDTHDWGTIKPPMDMIREYIQDNEIDIIDSKVIHMAMDPQSRNKMLIPSDGGEAYKSTVYRIFNAMKQFDSDRTASWGGIENLEGNSAIKHDLLTLILGAEEYHMIGKALAINQGINNKPEEIIKKVEDIQQYIKTMARNINRVHEFMNRSKIDLRSVPSVNLYDFLTDPIEAKRLIDAADKYKQSYNLLRIIRDVPHYHSYFESLLIAYEGLKRKSAKWAAMIELYPAMIEEYKISDKMLKDQTSKNIERAYNEWIRDQWLSDVIIELPKNSKIFLSEYSLVDNPNKTTIRLGNPTTNATFKLYMESAIIPKLKRDLTDNKFIQSLVPVVNTSNDSNVTTIGYCPKYEMMPRNEYQRDQFNQLLDAFNDLAKLDPIGGYSIQDLFYYYSMITYNGKIGSKSMQGIFESYTEGAAEAFSEVISESESTPAKIDETVRNFMKSVEMVRLLPVSSPWKGGAKSFRMVDSNTGEVWQWTLQSKKSNDYSEDGSPYEEEAQWDGDEWDGDEMDWTYTERTEINGYKRSATSLSPGDNQDYFGGNRTELTPYQSVTVGDSTLNFVPEYDKQGNIILTSPVLTGKGNFTLEQIFEKLEIPMTGKNKYKVPDNLTMIVDKKRFLDHNMIRSIFNSDC